MPSTTLSPRRRDALGALVAVLLLAGPVWVPALHLDDPTYRYERVRVTAGEGGVAFANASAVPPDTTPSDRIVCSGGSSRACAFERHLARNHTVLADVYAGSPGERSGAFALGPDRYDYVQIDGAVYEPTTLANRSRVYVVANGTVYEAGDAPEGVATSGDVYRNELSLRPVSPSTALAGVARDAEGVPTPIERAARTGTGVAHEDLSVPRTPIRTADGAYYRVYLADRHRPVIRSDWIETLLVLGAPAAGLVVLSRLRGRVAITYVGPSDDARSEDSRP
ncbi:hypothetical protein [Haloplanus halophilus]|uniref:hypothetical protein n=1 Tax=Haloplanus halophilus TaxID=2949993 RepID=UPI00203DA0B6|nr:hypothetical protein [Haloplanus sp. GDY1]